MPEVKQLQDFINANDNMEMLTVSLDGTSSAPRLRDTISEHAISYPVLHINAEDGWNDGAFDWEISGVPSAFIIDPMGNIFSGTYPQVGVIDVLDWLGAQETPVPLTGLAMDTTLQDDGSILVAVQMTSPTHEPFDVEVKATRIEYIYVPEHDTDGTGELNTYDHIDIEGLDLDFRQEFTMFGEARRSFVIPAQEGAIYVSIDLTTEYPGMEGYNDGKGYKASFNDLVAVNRDEE